MITLPTQIVPRQSTGSAVSVARSANGTLCLAWKGKGTEQVNLIFNTRQKGESWAWKKHVIVPNIGTVHAPAITYLGEKLFIAWITDDGSNRVCYTFSEDDGQSFGPTIQLDNAVSSTSPSFSGGKPLFIAFKDLKDQLNVMPLCSARKHVKVLS